MSNPTLDSIPKLQRNFTIRDEIYGPLIVAMQETGYHKWGFAVYRTTYDDDEAVQRFVTLMRKSVEEQLEKRGRKELLLQYHDFIIMDDKKRFNGATKAQIREHFVAWVEEQAAAGGIPEMALTQRWLIPRFTHCLVVDRGSVQTLLNYETWDGELKRRPPVACAIVDGRWESPGRGPESCPPIENCRKGYVGWMYITLKFVVPMYSENNTQDWNNEGIRNYERPPQIMPGRPFDKVPDVEN